MQRFKSIRPFIGATHFETSRSFYRDLGFTETVLSPGFSVFKKEDIAFYLQDANVKDWIDNSQVFVEVTDIDQYHAHLLSLNLPEKYTGVRLTPIRRNSWGSECFLHDPSGILWHFGTFNP
jgi:hypothetical protein